MERSGMMRCRPGTVTHTAFATVPDQRCTASLSLALHRIRDTSHLILISVPMGLDRRVHPLRKKAFCEDDGLHRNSGLPEFRITASSPAMMGLYARRRARQRRRR